MNRLHELIDGQPGERLAIIDSDGKTYRYDELVADSHRLASLLQNHGVTSGDRVIVVMENCALFVCVVLALSRIGAWMSPANARQSATEIDSVMAHSGACCALFLQDVSEQARVHAARLNATSLPDLTCGSASISPCQTSWPEPEREGDAHIAALMYTTGTTSAPKGVMLSHGNLIFNTTRNAERHEMTEQDQMYCVLPGSHIYGYASVMLPTLASGASLRLVPRFNAQTTLDHLRAGATMFPAVPQMLSGLLAELDARGEEAQTPHIRYLASAGAPLDPDLKARVEGRFGVPLNNGYGLTETSPTVAVTSNRHPRQDVSSGPPIPDLEILLDEPDEQGIGELLVRGPNIMQGYYRDPERTAEVMRKDGYFRTGDLVRLSDDGAIFLVGRKKELIIRSGFNVYPPEVEDILTRHQAVTQAAVIGRRIRGDEQIIAFVVTQADVSEEELMQWVRQYLVAYKVPQQIHIVSDYPSAATGKILKHKLLDHFAEVINEKDRLDKTVQPQKSEAS